MTIYTKKGDKGTTSLRSREKVWKDNLRVSAYGSVDELNSCIGMAGSYMGKAPRENYRKYLSTILKNIQNDLLFIGSFLADPKTERAEVDLNIKTKEFEKEIDKMTEKMPSLTNFILPGGGELASRIHFARAVARRAEREVVKLSKKEKTDSAILVYMNRLSDLLFTMARFANFSEKIKDDVWVSSKNNKR